MALTTTVLMDGPRNYVVHYASDAGDNITVDISTLEPVRGQAPTRVGLYEVKYSTDGDLVFNWNAEANPFLILDPSQDDFSWRDAGGLNNQTGAGNGDIEVNGSAATTYSLTLYLVKIFD